MTVPIHHIEECLIRLRAPDYETRRRAFDVACRVPKGQLEAAWKSARGLLPSLGGEMDCLGRVEIIGDPVTLERAIVTVVSPGYEELLQTLLAALKRVGEETPVVAFCVGASYENLETVNGLIRVRCHARERIDASIKGAVYSCARFVKAKSILALEVDCIPIEPLTPLWELVEQILPRETMAGVRPQAFPDVINSIQWVLNDERQEPTPLPWLKDELFLSNGGVTIGDFAAWQKLDSLLRELGPFAFIFVDGAMKRTYTEEMLLNWALNHMNFVELSPGWNVQFYDTHRELWLTTDASDPKNPRYSVRGYDAKILHFMGPVRNGPESLMDEILRELDNAHPDTPRIAKSPLRQCRDCGRIKGNCSCWLPGSTAVERNSRGYFSALCVQCAKKRGTLTTPLYEQAFD